MTVFKRVLRDLFVRDPVDKALREVERAHAEVAAAIMRLYMMTEQASKAVASLTEFSNAIDETLRKSRKSLELITDLLDLDAGAGAEEADGGNIECGGGGNRS